MSGGHFDYNSNNISDFSRDLQNEIENNNKPLSVDGDARDYRTSTITLLKKCRRLIQLSAEVSHEIEWLYSDDISEETAQDNILKLLSYSDIKIEGDD